MTGQQPRLRMFAGPNGSGKTTIKLGLKKPDDWFGIYINPDDIELSLKQFSAVAVTDFGLNFTLTELQTHFERSEFLRSHGFSLPADSISYDGCNITFRDVAINSYHASVLADFLRRLAIAQQLSFSFETVMSSPDKIDLLQLAQNSGFRTYLYFVATEDPLINISRVKYRVSTGGHPVPEEKIISRYHRSLKLLPQAIQFSHRAFFFDTSQEKPCYIGTTTNGETLSLESETIPVWFQESKKYFA